MPATDWLPPLCSHEPYEQKLLEESAAISTAAHLAPANADFRAACEKYKNIGVRVEDSFLVTSRPPERLSAGLPRTAEEVEAHFRRKDVTR